MIRAGSTLDVRSRAVTPADGDFLRRLYASTRSDLDVLGWSPEQRSAFCDLQWRAQREGYRSTHPAARDAVVEVDGEPAGRLLVDASGDDVVVVDVALMPPVRGQGIGTSILTRVLDEARAEGRRVRLHVERTNPAGRLYERLGFTPVGDDGVRIEMISGKGRP